MPQSQQQTREGSHVSHYQGKVTAYPMTHRSLWPVTTIHRHQPRIIMFNSFYLGPKSNSRGESGRCFSYLFIIFFFLSYQLFFASWTHTVIPSGHTFISLLYVIILFVVFVSLFIFLRCFVLTCLPFPLQRHPTLPLFFHHVFFLPLVLFWTQRKNTE